MDRPGIVVPMKACRWCQKVTRKEPKFTWRFTNECTSSFIILLNCVTVKKIKTRHLCSPVRQTNTFEKNKKSRKKKQKTFVSLVSLSLVLSNLVSQLFSLCLVALARTLIISILEKKQAFGSSIHWWFPKVTCLNEMAPKNLSANFQAIFRASRSIRLHFRSRRWRSNSPRAMYVRLRVLLFLT